MISFSQISELFDEVIDSRHTARCIGPLLYEIRCEGLGGVILRGDTMSETHVQELGHKPLWGNAVLSTSTVNDALEYEPGRPLLALFLRLSIALRELWFRRKRLGFRTGACINHLANEGCFLWTSQDVALQRWDQARYLTRYRLVGRSELGLG